ncbi:hypothetical protein [Salinicoccus roseus]|uniref:Uncharacterized protein n=2 Tax=Salinicoccus roseus TaxID=45670 RepID=A0ABT4YF71_9STAP|nr:hypothetical protein [Salinicoccus roseus]MDB0579405.1 hypothetical protein [Salinicoccus roseus]
MPLPISTGNFRRGIKCRRCHAFGWEAIGGKIGKCCMCGQVESVQVIARDYFTQFDRLFPHETYKRRDIIDHLRITVSEYTLQKIIRSNFRKLDHKERIYYFSPCVRLWDSMNDASESK